MLRHLFTLSLLLLSISCNRTSYLLYSPTSDKTGCNSSVSNWVKLRQEIINKYGENWYIENIYKPGGLISICFSSQSSNNEIRTGMFIVNSEYRDSSVIYSLKNSIVNLYCKGESLMTDLNVNNAILNGKIEKDAQYRDSILNDILLDNRLHCINLMIETGQHQFYYGNIDPRYQIKWAVGIERIPTRKLFFVESIEREYIEECHRRNIDAILSVDDLTNCTPERQELLFKYIEANDNSLIRSSCTDPVFTLDFEFATINEDNVPHCTFIRPL